MQLRRSLRWFVDATILVLLLTTAWRIVGIIRHSPVDMAVSAITPAVKSGDIFRLRGLVWSAPRTVVLVLRSTCPACNDNLPFYRQAAALATADVQVIAVSDQREAVIGEWLRQNQVNVRSIRQVADPGSLGLTLTPMVLIVNAEGRLTDVMIRKLDESDQAKVLERIRNPSATALDNSQHFREITTNEMEAMKSRRSVQILDVRSRERFQSGHQVEARNIPYPELKSRAPIELDSRVPVVVDCVQPGAAPSCRATAWMLIDAGFDQVSILIR